MTRPTRVLIVDDSASVRQALSAVLSADAAIEVMGTAPDPIAAARRIQASVPDVIVLDVEMPRMDGITFLRKLMAQHPIPVVMCSSHLAEGSAMLMQAFEAGAVDMILKPRVDAAGGLSEAHEQICRTVRAAGQARVGRARIIRDDAPAPKLTADAVLPPPHPRAVGRDTPPVIAIGASTGGTEALRIVLEDFPADAPATVIVQHMPPGFTRSFADRLDALCRVEVREARDGDLLRPGLALVAPGGGAHTLIERQGGRYRLSVRPGPLVARHRPSVDVLFRSAARAAGANAAGAILTGMGDDGAQGLLEMRRAGAWTIAQDEASCTVFGMPREAIARGAAAETLPLGRIAPALLRTALMRVGDERNCP